MINPSRRPHKSSSSSRRNQNKSVAETFNNGQTCKQQVSIQDGAIEIGLGRSFGHAWGFNRKFAGGTDRGRPDAGGYRLEAPGNRPWARPAEDCRDLRAAAGERTV